MKQTLLRLTTIKTDIPLYKMYTRKSVRRSIQFFLISVLPLLSSCIKEGMKHCPPLQVELSVKDKNYSNINNVALETRKSESLAFRDYVPTLYYTLCNVATGDIIEEQGIFNVTGNTPTNSITFCECLPFGTYVLNVWGGLSDQSQLTGQSLTSILHTNLTEANDVYLAHDTLVYDEQHSHHSLALQRTTGKLLIQIANLPATVRYEDNSIGQIYERVNHKFEYANPVTVRKQDTWNATPEIVLYTILAPSTGELQSPVHLNLYDKADRITPTLTPKDVNVTLKRNELTTLKYVYDDEKRDFNIFLLIDDVWKIIYNLDID